MRVQEAWWVQAVEFAGDKASQAHGFTQSLITLLAAARSSMLNASLPSLSCLIW